jgi:hypothetical protein
LTAGAGVSETKKCNACLFGAEVRQALGEDDGTFRWGEVFSPTAPGNKLEHLFDQQGQDQICQRFFNELRWGRAAGGLAVQKYHETMALEETDQSPQLIYLAHPVRGDFWGNVAKAKRWLAWANHELEGAVVLAPWLAEAVDRDDDEVYRALVMRRCKVVAARCDLVVQVGGSVSAGMVAEADACIGGGGDAFDLTSLGSEPPTDRSLSSVLSEMYGLVLTE